MIIDTPLFQRLRGVSQTALTYLTYPSAIHTRFEHSLNCMNLASKVIRELEQSRNSISELEHAEVRLAALLHDIGHCIFSHGSEFFYRNFAEFRSVVSDDELRFASPSEAECVNYCILTCEAFHEMLWEPVHARCRAMYPYLDSVHLKRVAEMIIGKAPDDAPSRRFQGDIINGPMDVDKLDYLARDGYFTGVNLSVDVDRLLPSLRAVLVEDQERHRKEKRLVVDQRGIAVVEQLLFARMLLYDTVYHHHKVRAANAALQSLLQDHHARPVWPTRSKKLESVVDFLDIDEYDFFGNKYDDVAVASQVRNLRYRVLPGRALVLAPRALCDEDSHTAWSLNYSEFTNREDPVAQKKASQFFNDIREKIRGYATVVGAAGLSLTDIVIDIPDPPRIGKLGHETMVQIVPEYVVQLSDLFPFHKVVTNYSTQYKYRTYVFGPEQWTSEIAYAAFRAFSEAGIRPNNLALILAHQEDGRATELLNRSNFTIPDWREEFYVPDAKETQ
ncbi:MAG: HD domain-containing protein [Verrucomicrobia bacterium]|nr:HD domain-containing protein [Verrucomicrobiota bacterium]